MHPMQKFSRHIRVQRRTAAMLTSTLIVSLVLLASGCATTSPTTYSLLGDKALGEMKLAKVLDTKDTLVILRYPMSLEPDAVPRFQQLYDNRGFVNYFYHAPDDVETVRWIGKNTGLEAREPRDVAGTHSEAIAKTTYFALAFYESLKKVLPPNAVRLQPVAIGQKAIQRGTSGALKWGESAPDALEEKPGIEYPPTVLYVDLFTYVHPYYRLGQPTSFGKCIAPLVTVRTAPAAAPETLGGIVTPSAFLPYTRQPDRDAGAAEGLGVSFVDYLNATAGVPPDHFPIPEKRLIEQLPIAPSNYLVLPVNQFDMAEAMSQTPVGTQRTSKPPEQAVFDAYQDIIISALNVIPYDVATRAARGRYIARYDRALAQRWTAGAELSRLDMKKVAVIRQFERAEWEFLGRQDEEFIERVFYGAWGDFMRQARVAEENFRVNYEKERSRRNNELMVRAFSMSMQSMANRQLATTPAGQLQANMNFLQQALGMLEESRQNQSDLANSSMNFNNHMHGILWQKTSFVFTMSGKTLDIHARSLDELRAEMRHIYLKMVGESPES